MWYSYKVSGTGSLHFGQFPEIFRRQLKILVKYSDGFILKDFLLYIKRSSLAGKCLVRISNGRPSSFGSYFVLTI